MKMHELVLVVTTTNDRENAESIALSLIEKNLAACVQISPIRSYYRWQGQTVVSEEFRLEIKTVNIVFDKIQKQIKTLHTYDVPEIIMMPIENCNTDYRDWVHDEVAY